MRRLVMTFSAFIFMTGCFIVLGTVLYTWAYIMVVTAKSHWLIGWVALLCSLAGYVWYRVNFDPPWRAWFQVWQWADAEIERRLQ